MITPRPLLRVIISVLVLFNESVTILSPGGEDIIVIARCFSSIRFLIYLRQWNVGPFNFKETKSFNRFSKFI